MLLTVRKRSSATKGKRPMYETLHSERVESPNYHGITFVAQLLGGELRFYAHLTIPLGVHKLSLEVRKDEWDDGHDPYRIHVADEYKKAFETKEVQNWIESTVTPWADRTKRTFLEKNHEYTLECLAEMEKELDRLNDLV